MFSRIRHTFVSLILIAAFAAHGFAQISQQVEATKAPAATETREQILQRLGLAEDPGPDPDPKKVFIRYGEQYTIEKYEMKWAKRMGRPGWIKPMAMVNIEKEIYQENDDYVWVFMRVRQPEPEPELREGEVAPPPLTGTIRQPTERQVKYLTRLREEFKVVPFLESGKAFRFEEASAGLPVRGSWRNSLDVADMNEDGHLDIISPPERSGSGDPVIFLGDSKGTWSVWQEVVWPMGLNYGSVVAGDLNRDGHQDLVFGVHLYGVVAFLGDGKGTFTDSSKGLPIDFPTRRAILADVDKDRDLDILVLTEGPRMWRKEGTKNEGSKLRVYLNQNKAGSWKSLEVAEAGRLMGGDWMTTGNFNGDAYPDILTASTYFSGPDIFYLSKGSAKWTAFGRGWMPWRSYYFSVAAGNFASKKRDDAIISFGRAWPTGAGGREVRDPQITAIVGFEKISWSGKEPVRSTVASWPGQEPVWGLAKGDFDGDGDLDLAILEREPRRFSILLNDGKGNFTRADVTGVTPRPNAIYDLKVADVNGDRKPDLLVMYESGEKFSEKDGSVNVYLNRGIGGSGAR